MIHTGFTFGSSVGAYTLSPSTCIESRPQLFGAIFGYAILKPLSRLATDSLLGRMFGGHFGPKENCTVQSAATAAGALGKFGSS
jgi:hypothetical protein